DDHDISVVLNRSAADRFKLISGYLPGARASSSFFRGMISSHYRYHSLLAPSIVDAIDDERDAKGRLLNTFVKKGEVAYRQMFEPAFRSWELITGRELPEEWEDKIEEVSNFVRSSGNRFRRIVDWDTLVSRILIYNGPTELIKIALLHDTDSKQDGKDYNQKDKDRIEEVCKQIIAGLEMRYIDSIFDAHAVSKKKDKVYEVFGSGIENLKTLFPGDDHTIKLECKALAQSYIDAIVKTLTKIEEGDNPNEKFRFNKFAENSVQDSLSILKSSSGKTEKYSKNAQHTFLRTITAFLSFYEGIYECCQHNMRYEFEKSANILSPNEIEEYRWKIEETFIVGVRRETERLNKEFSGENAIKNALTELWRFSDRNAEKTEARAKYYHAMLARAPINNAKLSKIFDVDGDDINVKENGRSFDYNVLLKNDTKHIMFLWKVINFLAGNESDGAEDDYKGRDGHTSYKEHVRRVVYPQVVTFAQHHMDGDSNESLIMMDSGNAFAVLHESEVRILTEFQHKMNRAYYALPNLNRIETKWWVDPFLIPCYKFDREIRSNYNRMEMKI
ncbi:MAG: hypothetical protein LBE48_01900, partial [Methanomassiliicoccaceae archaeon]|nr:hypothetical protein [Methanomassiliicoccaceae archaeon]